MLWRGLDATIGQLARRARPTIDALASDVARREPEAVAAAVNVLLVLVSPIAVVAALAAVSNADTTRTTVVAFPVRAALINLATAALIVEATLPLALIAGWRTWSHARRYRAGIGTGWRGVGEGGAFGLLIALILLSPYVANRPFDAPPYIAAYGGFALVLGLSLGLVLWASAMIVLRLQERISAR
jgi:hypothetical protein